MGNFIEAFKKGQLGRNKGLSTGIHKLNQAINGIQKKSIYGIAAPPKCGKTTFCDYAFLLKPFLIDMLENGVEIDWIYYSFEVDRVYKEYKFAAFFFDNDFGIGSFSYNGKTYPMSAEYLLGKVLDEYDNFIPVTEEHKTMLQEIYANRIVPLFGEYDAFGRKLTAGKIEFVEERTNPTGIRNHLLAHAQANGEFIYEEYFITNQVGDREKRNRKIGYIPTNPDKFTIIITDHLRKLIREQKFSMKENVDKLIEYQVELRNLCGYTFVDIIHLNRDLTDPQRLKQNPEYLYPTGDDVKDTGNLSEEANIMFTMFDPNDVKYNLKKHFGLPLYDSSGGLNYPKYKSLHLVDAREVEAPVHFALNMYGNINKFESLSQQLGYGFG